MPKELYLLIGTVLGAFVSLIAGMITGHMCPLKLLPLSYHDLHHYR